MSTPDGARLLDDVAASIADGEPVDWMHPAAQLPAREQRLIRHLRLIESLAVVYRTLPSDPDEDEALDPLREPEPAGPRWGRLILLDRIGQGASADVFRAWDIELQREVALKLLHVDGDSDATANARVLQEARRLARVGHPHVVHVYGAERHEERIGLWMELVRGRTLEEIVREDGPLSSADTAAIGADLCGALSAVHAAGLLHRDVKAQNAIRDASGRVVLMDFGTGEEIAMARPAVAGTPLYLAPEILAGGQASRASDVYSLGVLLFHLASGSYPVHADAVEALASAHRAGRRVRLREAAPGVPTALARIVERALDADPGRRYATAAEMEQELRTYLHPPAAVPTESTWRRWLVAAVGVLAVAVASALVATVVSRRLPANPGHTTIAVLPLRAAPGDGSAELAEGLTAQLISTLGQIKTLRVTALPSVLRFKDRSQAPAAIAQQLGVDGVFDGTVTVDSGAPGAARRVHVNGRVLEAGSGAELWSGSLERPLGDLAVLEEDLARALARSIHARLSPGEVSRLQSARSTTPEAEQAYLQGRAHLSQFASRATLALRAFKRATDLDPRYAAAHAGAARSYIALGFDHTISQPEARAAALAEVSRALDLDPALPEGHGVLGDLYFFYDWNFAAAEREYRLALDSEPSASYERAQYAQFLAAMGRLDEARREIDEAERLDPLSAQAALTKTLILYYGRRYDDALAAARHAGMLDPTLPTTHFLLGRIFEAVGDLSSASEETQRAIDSSAVVAVGWRVQALRLMALRGRVQEARTGYAALVRASDAGDLESSAYEAYLRLATGEPDAALTVLGRAVARRDPSVLWLDVDPRLDPIRARAEFSALRRRIGLR